MKLEVTESLQKKLSSTLTTFLKHFEPLDHQLDNPFYYTATVPIADVEAFEKQIEEAVRNIAKEIQLMKKYTPHQTLTGTKLIYADKVLELLVGSSPSEAKQ